MGTTYFYIIKYIHLPAPESVYFPSLLNTCSHLTPYLPLVHWIKFSLVNPKALLWQFLFSCSIYFLLSASLFTFTCLSPDHYTCVYICTIYAYICLVFFRETLLQWASCSCNITSSASLHTLTKVNHGLNLSQSNDYFPILILLDLSNIWFNLSFYSLWKTFVLSFCVSTLCWFPALSLVTIYLSPLLVHPQPPDCCKLKYNRVLSSTLCFPVCIHSRG